MTGHFMGSSPSEVSDHMNIQQTPERGAAQSAVSFTVSPQPIYDALVLDAAQRQALVTVRSLGSRGLRIAGVEAGSCSPAFVSRWLQQRFAAPTHEYSGSSYFTFLNDLLDRAPARVVIPAADGTIALLRAHREALEKRVRIALAGEPALQIAINKEQTLAAARRLGVAVPQTVIVRRESDIPAAIQEIGLPAVIKPVESWMDGGQGGVRVTAQLVTTHDEARRVIAAAQPFHASMVVQKYLSGRREAVMIMYAHDEVYARFAQWAKRMYPPLGGSSVLRQSIAVPGDSGAYAERLVRDIGLEGYSEVEFRRDERGIPYLMEINPRLSASVEVAVRAGVDFPYLLYQWANGDPISRVRGYREGIWQRHLGNDIRLVAAAFLEPGRLETLPPGASLRDFFASFFVRAGYDYADWRDPLPALAATASFIWRALGYFNPWAPQQLRNQKLHYRFG